MSLKKGSKILVGFLCFLLGAIISYILSQYKLLNIEMEFNVVEMLLSIGTIGIGLYIAIVLDRNKMKSQNFYTFIEKKYDTLWEEFIQFSDVLGFSRNIELAETSRQFKSIFKKLTPLIKVIESFEHDSSCLTSLEEHLEDLERFISSNNNISENILDLSVDRDVIDQKLLKINEHFANTFKDLAEV